MKMGWLWAGYRYVYFNLANYCFFFFLDLRNRILPFNSKI